MKKFQNSTYSSYSTQLSHSTSRKIQEIIEIPIIPKFLKFHLFCWALTFNQHHLKNWFFDILKYSKIPIIPIIPPYIVKKLEFFKILPYI